MTRADVLAAEAVAVGATVLMVEHRRTDQPDRLAMRALQRDCPDTVSSAIMRVLIEGFGMLVDQHGPSALRRAGLVVATARLEVA